MTVLPGDVLFPENSDSSEALADLDWVTGLIRFHGDRRSLEAATSENRKTLDRSSIRAAEVLSHELCHVFQLGATGFGYGLSHDMFRVVYDANLAFETLSEIYENAEMLSPRLSKMFAILDTPGAAGITTRDILEGSAYLVQKRSSAGFRGETLIRPSEGTGGPGSEALSAEERSLLDRAARYDAAEFLRSLHYDSPGREYQIAYEVAVRILGANAHEMFLPLVVIALCTRSPHLTYEPLLRYISSRALAIAPHDLFRVGERFVRDHFPGMWLGTAWDVAREGGSQPFLDRVLAQAGFPTAMAAEAWVMEFARTGVITLQYYRALIGIIAFRHEVRGKAALMVPSRWATSVVPRFPFLKPDVSLFYAAASHLLQQEVEDPAILPGGMIEYSFDEDKILFEDGRTLRFWTFDASSRNVQTIGHLGRILDSANMPKSQLLELRGSIKICFPDPEFPGAASPFVDSGVTTFLRTLFEEVPFLPYFLATDVYCELPVLVVAAYDPSAVSVATDGAVRVIFRDASLNALTRVLAEALDLTLWAGGSLADLLRHLDDVSDGVRDIISERLQEECRGGG